MKFRAIGIAPGTKSERYPRKASDYSNKIYDGIQLRRNHRNEPVVIMCSKRDDPLRWKVVYGFSSIFFRTLAEAVEFCNSRGMELVKEQYE